MWSFSVVPPTFLSPEPEVLDYIVGDEITLNCTAMGNPAPVYSWQSSHPIQERMEDEAALTSSSLLPGTYTCTASNALEKKSKQFIVKAKTKGRREQWSAYVHVAFIHSILISFFFCFYLGVWNKRAWDGIRRPHWTNKEKSTKRILMLKLWRRKWQYIHDSTDIYMDLAIRQN